MSTSTFNLSRFSCTTRHILTIVLPGLLYSPNVARAESTNKRMILPGARAQALSGAYTAVADDASAGWYNPAGLGFLRSPGVSVSVNNYSKSHKDISGVTSDTKLAENSSSIYPGFAGSNASLGPFTFGWSYFTLDQQNTDESQSLNIASSESTNAFTYDRAELTSGNLIHAGASVAFKLGQNFSLGVSEYYYRRQKQTALKERSTFASGVFYDSFVRQSTLNEGTVTIVGLMARTGTFSLGITARIPKALSDKTELEAGSIIYTGATPELSSSNLETRREDELIVRTWTAGLAWVPASFILVSLDAVHYPATNSPWLHQGGFNTKTVTDWSAGFEILTSSLIIAGGLFTNSSLVETPTPSLVASEPARIDYQGFSSSIGLRSKQSETMLIMVRQKGVGKSQMVQGDLSLQSISIETQSFSIASRYNF
jgi:hypothetical protein